MVKTSNTVRGNKFQVTKDIIKNHQSEKSKQCNSQNKRQINKTNVDNAQDRKHKSELLKTGVEFSCSRWISSSFSTSGTCRVILATNPMRSHERGKEDRLCDNDTRKISVLIFYRYFAMIMQAMMHKTLKWRFQLNQNESCNHQSRKTLIGIKISGIKSYQIFCRKFTFLTGSTFGTSIRNPIVCWK
jgi:outer membrane receptor for monomeric catechols